MGASPRRAAFLAGALRVVAALCGRVRTAGCAPTLGRPVDWFAGCHVNTRSRRNRPVRVSVTLPAAAKLLDDGVEFRNSRGEALDLEDERSAAIEEVVECRPVVRHDVMLAAIRGPDGRTLGHDSTWPG